MPLTVQNNFAIAAEETQTGHLDQAGTICGFDYIARLARYSQRRVTTRRDVADHGWRLYFRYGEKLLRILLFLADNALIY